MRTVAIIPVLLFHLGVSTAPGGFIGVDVFFVISGYLITSGLMYDLQNQRFSFAKFYQRRILRIFPALFVLLSVVSIASTFVYFPGEIRSIGLQVLSSSAFVSNLYFWNEAGYFTAAAENQPLLHTWSLAVEELFYLLFPLLLFLLYKFARNRLVHVLIALAALSFLGSVILTYVHQPTAFYLLPARAWEMGAGSLLGILGARACSRRGRLWLSVLGAALILVPVLTYQPQDPVFPGWSAFFPVLGAVLLIGWADGTPVGKALSWRPMVWVGKISFSLYLWHWPLIVLYKASNGPTLNALEMIGIGAASFVFAFLSTELVERPFRSIRAREVPYRKVISTGLVVATGIVGLGVFQSQNPVSGIDASPEALKVAEVSNYRDTSDYDRQFRKGACLIGEDDGGFESFDTERCATADRDKLNVLVMGDSHAAMFWGALDEAYPNANVMQATASGCRPLIDSPGAARCTAVRDWAFDAISGGEIDRLIIGGRWESGEMSYVVPTLEFAEEHVDNVVVMGPTVEYDGEFPTLLARSMVNGHEFKSSENRTPGRVEADRDMRAAAEDVGAEYISVLDTICTNGDCVTRASDGYPMQFDYGHLTLSGSRYVIEAQSKVLDGIFESERGRRTDAN